MSCFHQGIHFLVITKLRWFKLNCLATVFHALHFVDFQGYFVLISLKIAIQCDWSPWFVNMAHQCYWKFERWPCMSTEDVIAKTRTLFGLFCLQIHSRQFLIFFRCFSTVSKLINMIVKCRRLGMQSHLNTKLLGCMTWHMYSVRLQRIIVWFYTIPLNKLEIKKSFTCFSGWNWLEILNWIKSVPVNLLRHNFRLSIGLILNVLDL